MTPTIGLMTIPFCRETKGVSILAHMKKKKCSRSNIQSEVLRRDAEFQPLADAQDLFGPAKYVVQHPQQM